LNTLDASAVAALIASTATPYVPSTTCKINNNDNNIIRYWTMW
jgi:hypothetical protein